jgi:hypothetical protein
MNDGHFGSQRKSSGETTHQVMGSILLIWIDGGNSTFSKQWILISRHILLPKLAREITASQQVIVPFPLDKAQLVSQAIQLQKCI